MKNRYLIGFLLLYLIIYFSCKKNPFSTDQKEKYDFLSLFEKDKETIIEGEIIEKPTFPDTNKPLPEDLIDLALIDGLTTIVTPEQIDDLCKNVKEKKELLLSINSQLDVDNFPDKDKTIDDFTTGVFLNNLGSAIGPDNPVNGLGFDSGGDLNPIENFHAGIFCFKETLEALVIRDAKIDHAHFVAQRNLLSQLEFLKRLDLQNNQNKIFIEDINTSFLGLYSLNLSGIKNMGDLSKLNLNYLEKLEIRGDKVNKISGFSCSSLQYLDAENNFLSKDQNLPAYLQNCPLKNINLKKNGLEPDQLNSIIENTDPQFLDLSLNNEEENSTFSLSSTSKTKSNLEVLYLSQTQLNISNYDVFDKIPNLKKLDVSKNSAITSIDFINKLGNLKELWIQGTSIDTILKSTCDAFKNRSQLIIYVSENQKIAIESNWVNQNITNDCTNIQLQKN